MLVVFLKSYLCRLRNFFVGFVFLRLWQPFLIRCVWRIANMLQTKYTEHVHSNNYIGRGINSKATGKCPRCKWHRAVQYGISRTDALWKILNKLLFPSLCSVSRSNYFTIWLYKIMYKVTKRNVVAHLALNIALFIFASYN